MSNLGGDVTQCLVSIPETKLWKQQSKKVQFYWISLYCSKYFAQDCSKNQKIEKLFGDELDFEIIKFPVKIDIQKIEKMNSIEISGFAQENKEKYLLYVSKNTFKKHVDLLDGEDKKHYVFIKGFNIFIFQSFNMIILYIVEGIIFVVIVCQLLGQKKY